MVESLFQKTLKTLKTIAHTPTKKFGQNFLIDQNVVEKFVRLANLHENDNIVEIGPGVGTVSEEILSYKTNLYAIELDNRLFRFLSEKYSQNKHYNLTHGDAVKFPIAGFKNTEGRYKIVASLPYAISSSWFESILSCGQLPESISVIIQLDAANRFLAEHNTKSFGPISIFIQSAFSKIEMHKIAKNSFYPIPKVDSVMLFFKQKTGPFIFSKQNKDIIRLIFTNRRKQISKIAKEQGLDIQPWLQRNNILPCSRSEQIPLSVWQDFSIRF